MLNRKLLNHILLLVVLLMLLLPPLACGELTSGPGQDPLEGPGSAGQPASGSDDSSAGLCGAPLLLLFVLAPAIALAGKRSM